MKKFFIRGFIVLLSFIVELAGYSQTIEQAVVLFNKGNNLYNNNKYNEAIEKFQEAAEINKKLGIRQKEDLRNDFIFIGNCYQKLGEYYEALGNYQKVITLDKDLVQKAENLTYLKNIDQTYDSWGQSQVETNQKTSENKKETKIKKEDVIPLNNIGNVFYIWGQYNKSLEYYNKALVLDHDLQRKDEIAGDLNNIGLVYWDLKNYKGAEDYLNRSVSLIDVLWQAAKEEKRRDYLAREMPIYQKLIFIYIKENKYDLAFDTIEISSIKFLFEQINETPDANNFKFEGIKNYQKKLDKNTAIISFVNVNSPEYTQIIVDKNNIYGIEVENKQYIENIFKKYQDVITQGIEKIKSSVKAKKKKNRIKEVETAKNGITKIINYYRLLLTNPKPGKEVKQAIECISKELYKFLLGAIETRIKDKTNLIIIPNGIIDFIPFETLVMPDGRCLCEKYNIKYTKLLTASEMMIKQKYNEDNKLLLSFDGALYDEITYKSIMKKFGQ